MAQRTRKPYIPNIIDEYVVKETISQSPEGVVLKAYHRTLCFNAVIKVINDRLNPSEFPTFSTLDHKHIVKFFEAFKSQGFTFIVMEYVECGDLSDYLQVKKKLSEDEARFIFYQVVDAVHYLHTEMKIAHRDIKPENLLIDKDFQIKFCDFAFATQICPKSSHQEWLGSVEYCSPELVNMIPYSGDEVDLWALGVLLFEMLTGKVPFNNLKFTELVIPESISSECRELITSLLEMDRSKRFNIEQTLKHPWVAKGKDQQLPSLQISLPIER